ncbi:MAG: motility protein A [Nitrospinaceae bacterium]|nr:motility protein A [Nitrospinaceae bacterium]
MSTAIGIFVGGGLLFYAILSQGGIAIFYDPGSLMIGGGGTLAAILISFPLQRVVGVFRILKNVFGREISDASAYIAMVVRLAHKARKESILSLQEDAKNVNNRIMRMGLQLVIDGQPPEIVRAVLETELDGLYSRHDEGARIFKSMGRYSPAFGLIGTLIGLVSMLRSLSGGTENLGPGMAVALITTFYGALFSNLFFLPMADKLENRSEKEVQQIRIVIEGILMIQEGGNPRLIEQKLNAYLEPDQRIQHFERMLRREKGAQAEGG